MIIENFKGWSNKLPESATNGMDKYDINDKCVS